MAIPFDARVHLREEFRALAGRLGAVLTRSRNRGRSALSEAVGGMVIEDGEAEALVADLVSTTGAAAQRSADYAERWALEDAAARQGARLPLRQARAAFALTDAEYDLLLLALAVELDGRFARLVAYLNDHAARSRPSLALAQMLALSAGEELDLADLPQRPCVADGLLELDGDGPLATRSVRVATNTLARFAHDAAVDLPAWLRFRHEDLNRLERLVLSDAPRTALQAWVAQLRAQRVPSPLLLVGHNGSGRTAIAAAAAGAAGMGLVTIEIGEPTSERLLCARREARWARAAILLKVDAPPADWSALWRFAVTLPLPVSIALPPELRSAALASAREQPLEISCGTFTPEQRVQLWQRLLPPGEPLTADDLAPLAARFRSRPGAMARALKRAQLDTVLAPAGARKLTAERLATAVRASAADALGQLAQRLTTPFVRDDLVVPERVARELELARAWIASGPTVLDTWGLGQRIPYGRGLTALFAGPPGTGKTMGAQVLARELGLDLYRVDLSQVVNKYIGETEKNLGRLFDLAAESDAVLFFDEADALFGKRSEVKDAHDRYANLEIGYLLTRMEAHDGVTILASNRAADLDEAFVRRFHIVADFPRPTKPEQLRIWQGLLVSSLPRAADVDPALLAQAFDLSGGEIKNCVLAAAYLAVADGGIVARRHLVAAVRRELLKNGRVVDERACAGLLASD